MSHVIPHCKDFTPLHMAVLCHNTDCVKKLLLAPAIDVNIKDRYGRTPVMLASGNYEMLTLLRSCSDFPVHTFSKSYYVETVEQARVHWPRYVHAQSEQVMCRNCI